MLYLLELASNWEHSCWCMATNFDDINVDANGELIKLMVIHMVFMR